MSAAFELEQELSDQDRVDDTRGTPWRWICSIRVDFPEQVIRFANDTPATSTFGTGLLVTPRHVLTSAHLFHALEKRGGHFFVVPPKEITVVPGRDDERVNPRPFRSYRGQLLGIPQKFRELAYRRASAPFDYAALRLNKAVGDKTFLKLDKRRLGWWGKAYDYYMRPVAGNFRQDLEDRKVNVAGYPSEGDSISDDYSTPSGIQHHGFDWVWDAYPQIDGKTVPLVAYLVNASEGNSGGPVWIKDKSTQRRYLVAIHRGRLGVSAESDGVLITPEVIDQLERWGISRQSLSLVP